MDDAKLRNVRIVGVDIPRNKRLVIALTYVKGIGLTTAKKVCQHFQFEDSFRAYQLDTTKVRNLSEYIESNFLVEGELRRKVEMDIRTQKDIKSYRGQRHRKNLPTRGQRTHTNAKTRKGRKSVPIAGKKKL